MSHVLESTDVGDNEDLITYCLLVQFGEGAVAHDVRMRVRSFYIYTSQLAGQHVGSRVKPAYISVFTCNIGVEMQSETQFNRTCLQSSQNDAHCIISHHMTCSIQEN